MVNLVLVHHKARNTRGFQAKKSSASSSLLDSIHKQTLGVFPLCQSFHYCLFDDDWCCINVELKGSTYNVGTAWIWMVARVLSTKFNSWNRLRPAWTNCDLDIVNSIYCENRKKETTAWTFLFESLKKVTRWKNSNIFELCSGWFERWLTKSD